MSHDTWKYAVISPQAKVGGVFVRRSNTPTTRACADKVSTTHVRTHLYYCFSVSTDTGFQEHKQGPVEKDIPNVNPH